MLKRNFIKGFSLSLLMVVCFSSLYAQTGFTKNETAFSTASYHMKVKPVFTETCGKKNSVSDSTMVVEITKTKERIPQVSLNPKAVKFVAEYLVENNETLELVKKKSASYFKVMDAVFSKNELPLQLKYLAVIESKLKPSALSGVGACGLWQLMPQTARSLGLKVSSKYDERKQTYKSTLAAARYLKDLYAQFGDWLLVIAAYNSGPVGVYKAIKKSGSHNFWQLQNFLPAETKAHVKRFIGAHYYFEEKGSETTLTKGEAIAYKKLVAEFEAHNKEAEEAETASETIIILVANDSTGAINDCDLPMNVQ